jgi:predicted DNA-binding protein with PD1-like motif
LAHDAENAGDLNFILTSIIHTYLKKKGIKYANINEVIGMLECCKLELYRKIAAPYEDIKIQENGDVLIIHPDDLTGQKY